MEDFLQYNELQCMLLSMDSDNKINDIKAFIDKNQLFDKQHTLSTLKLISSAVFAYPQYFKNAVKLLKFYDNIQLKNPLFIGLYPNNTVLERSYLLYALLWYSDKITYTILGEYHCNYMRDKIMEFIHTISPEKNKKDEEKTIDDLIFQAIFDDDVDLLQNLISNNKFDINQKLNINYWIPSKPNEHNLLIEYSISLGSIKCFKFLLSITERIEYSQLFILAIQGRNKEIYNIIEKEIPEMYMPYEYLQYTILFMNNELFDYFIKKLDYNVGCGDIIDCIYTSNYYALLSFKNTFSVINRVGEFESTPIDTAAYEGDLYFLKYLIEVLKADTHILNSYGKTILQSAVKSNQIEIVKYIINNNLVDVHDTGKWPQRPLDIAYFFQYNDMIAFLNKVIFKNGRTRYGSGKIENNRNLNDTFYYKPDNKSNTK